MSSNDREQRILDYGDEAVKGPADRAVEYGQKAVAAPGPALTRGAVAVLGGPLLMAPSGATERKLSVARLDVAVGEPISLDVGLAFGSIHWLSGGFLTDISWKIPGKTVKAYKLSHFPTKVVELSAHDKKQPQIAFHWVNAGTARKVTATCKVSLPILKKEVSLVFHATFNVMGPTLDHFHEHRRKKNERGRTRIGTNSADLKQIKGQRFLEFTGKIKHKTKRGVRRHSGVIWNWQVTAPAGHGGKIKDLQTFFSIRKSTKLLDRGSTQKVRQRFKMRNKPMRTHLASDLPLGQSILDSTKIEDAEPRYGSEFPMPIAAGESLPQIAGHDSPDHSLSPGGLGVRLFIHEKFKYFVLYKPNIDGSIWVPVGKSEWFWKGEAVRELDGPWRLVQKDGGVTDEGGRTSEFPEYDGHAGELNWEDVESDE